MLSIHASNDTEGAKRYFRENLSQADYLGEKSAVIGKWSGKTADILGLWGPVQKKDFDKLIDNFHPRTGKQLTPRNSPNRRNMYDCTFSACKSFSILATMLPNKKDRQDLLDAQNKAVEKTMRRMEEDIRTQSGQGKQKYYPKTGNMIWGSFQHDTGRPLEKKDEELGKIYVPDPQIHNHAVLLNVTHYAPENRFRAIEMGTVKTVASMYEALYHSYLGAAVKDLGYALEKDGKRWEVKGIDKVLRNKFSGRTIEIEKVAELRGIKSARSKADLGRMTRNKKEVSVADSLLPDIWKSRLSKSEYDTIVNAKGRAEREGNNGKDDKAITAQKAVQLALDHFMERQSGVPEARVLGYAIDLTSAEIAPEQIEAELAGRDDIIDATQSSIKYITTRAMLGEEERLIERSASGKARHVAINPDYEIDKEKSAFLNSGQRHAIRHVLESKDQIIMVSGDAGVGKTTLMEEVKKGIEQANKRLLAFAPSADASRGSLQDKGFSGAETISKLLNSPELQKELKDNFMLIDEAGMVGVPTMNKLLDIADQQGCRPVLVGDWKQHPSIERGDAQRLMETYSGLSVARVEEIVRQRKNPVYKQVVEHVAKGIGIKDNPEKRQLEVKKAYDQIDKQGHVIEEQDLGKRHEQIANDYLKASEKSPKDVIVVAPTHGEGKDITEAIRNKLKEQGRLGEQDKQFERLQNLNLTGTEKQIASNFSKGQIVEFHQHAPGIKAGSRNEIVGRDDKDNVLIKNNNHEQPIRLPLDKFEHFDVYEKQNLSLAEGDRIRITKNVKSLDGKHLFNGQQYEATGFTEQGHIQLSNGQTLHKEAKHLNTGYYQTSYGAQGKDAKNVLVAQSSQSLGASNDKQFYVTISRGTENLKIYTDNKAELRESIARSADRLSAGEIAEKSRQQKSQQANRNKHAEYMRQVKAFNELHVQPAIEKMKSRYEREKGQFERPMDGPELSEGR